MRFHITAAVLITVAATGTTRASEICEELSRKFENSAKVVSLAIERGAWDNSVPRLTLHQLQINNQLLLQQMNLNLLIINKCSLPSHPVGLGDYSSDALECQNTRERGKAESPLCKMEQWKRDDSK